MNFKVILRANLTKVMLQYVVFIIRSITKREIDFKSAFSELKKCKNNAHCI